jgi:hypothetical protein
MHVWQLVVEIESQNSDWIDGSRRRFDHGMRVTPSFRLRRILPKKQNDPTTLKMTFCGQSFIKVTQDTLHHEQSSWTTPTHVTISILPTL